MGLKAKGGLSGRKEVRVNTGIGANFQTIVTNGIGKDAEYKSEKYWFHPVKL